MVSLPHVSARWMRRGMLVIVVAIATSLCHFSTLPSWALGYPAAADPYLSDYAQVISPADAPRIRQSLADLRANHGIEAQVITINSIQDYGTGDSTIESFATNLFNSLGIGDREKNNGILTLVAVRDRKVRIEVGAGYGTSLDSAMKSVIDEYMVPRFKQDDYSGGVVQGTDAIIRRVTNAPSLSPSAPSPQPVYSPSEPADLLPVNNSSPNGSWLLGGGLVGLGGVGTLIYRQFTRYRRRHCPGCGTDMVRLDENSDNQYLDQGQNVEEELGSVDYDVWQCPSCKTQDINRYGSLFSQYKTCRSCHYQTLSTRRQVLSAATYSSSGTEEVTESCHHCSYQNTYTVTIPMKERSTSHSGSSHGGSSFGGGGGHSSGGHSSGGGASGGW